MNIRRRHVVLLIFLYASIAAGTAYASIVASRSLSASVTIQSQTPGLAVLEFAGAACSPELTSISFPVLGPNLYDQSSASVCIKNVGNTNFWIINGPDVTSVIFSGVPPGINTRWVREGLGEQVTLPVLVSTGSTIYINLFLDNDGTAAPGSIVFTITFRGYSTSTG